MPRPIWSGAISFGLVNVPVRMYGATTSHALSFHLLHAKDGARLRTRRICTKCGEEVPLDEMARGYEIEKDRYVMVTDAELESVAPETSRSIEVESFVEAAEIDPVMHERSYWLVPGAGGGRGYELLVQALGDSGRAAIGRVVLRTHEYLCAVRCSGDALLLTTLLYADELVSPKDIDLPGEKPKPAEVKTATQLIESLTGPLEHDKFRDEQREGQIDLLDRLAHGEKIRKPEKREEKPAQSAEDLMAALEKSLERARARSSERMAEDGGAKKNGGSKKAASPRKKRS